MRSFKLSLFIFLLTTIYFFPNISRADITIDLIGYWNFNEESGTVANDSSGNNNNGTLTNGVFWTNGYLGNATGFDGGDDYINIGNNSIFDIRDEITISAWVKPSQKTSNCGGMWLPIVGKNGEQWQTNGVYALTTTDCGMAFIAYTRYGTSTSEGTNNIYSVTISANKDVWQNVVMTKDSSNLKIYVNGSLKKAIEAPLPILTTESNLYIGSNYNGVRTTKGEIDEVKIYNRSLNENEVLELYNSYELDPPIRSQGSVSNKLSGNLSRVRLFLNTNEDATCKHSNTANADYNAMANTFSETGKTRHSTLVDSMYNNNVYNFYIKCKDINGNINPDDYNISFTYKDINIKSTPYLLMVTSMDSNKISSTPLLDISTTTISLFNESPFDGVALNLVDIYSAQPIVGDSIVINKANQLKNITNKDIWVRVNMNRIYQRDTNHSYYESGHTKEEVQNLAVSGISTGTTNKISTAYFEQIKKADIYDEQGTLSDFYLIWRNALKFAKINGSGIVLDLENYHHADNDYYRLTKLAAAQRKPESEIIIRLNNIGKELVDIATDEYSDVTILSLFANLYMDVDNYLNTGYSAFPSYIFKGILDRAKEKNILLKFIDGGESDVGYVNTDLDSLKNKIDKRWHGHRSGLIDWLGFYPDNFNIGGTITLWDNQSQISGWVKNGCGTNCPFYSLNDFKPYLKELFRDYNYIWIYVPSLTEYDPFNPSTAPIFNNKLETTFNSVFSDLGIDKIKPSIPTNLNKVLISAIRAEISWTPSTDDVSISGYKIYRDGAEINTTQNTSYMDANLSPNINYSYQVSAYDSSGNESAKSESITVITQSSNTSPVNNSGGSGGGAIPSSINPGITVPSSTATSTSTTTASSVAGNATTTPISTPDAQQTNPQIVQHSMSNMQTLFIFTKPLKLKSEGEEVKRLQEFLSQDKEIYPERLITGYYGQLTVKAVQRFQKKHGIVSTGSPETTGYGLAGPKTIAKLNELMNQSSTSDVEDNKKYNQTVSLTSNNKEFLIIQLKQNIIELMIKVIDLMGKR